MTTPAPATPNVRRLTGPSPTSSGSKQPHPGFTQGTLALDLPAQPNAPPPGLPTLTLVSRGQRSGDRVSATGVPDVHEWAARFVQAIVEVISGDRPLTQLVRWTSEAVYIAMAHRVKVLAATTSASRGRLSRAHVQSVHICQPCDEVAEVAVHLRHGARSRAVAARLELVQGRWLCTALQMG